MVSADEVDGQLKMEILNECSKFGRVLDCKVHVDTSGLVPEEDIVRIFVKFEAQAGADSALNSLDGRFFGGRRVSASYYSEGRFDTECW